MMKRIIVSALTILTFLAGPVQAGDIEFRSAYHTDRAVLFDEFAKIDWEQLAKTHFKAFPLTNLSNAQIQELAKKKNMFDNVEFHYVAPLPKAYKAAKFVFLSASGVRSVSVIGLRGSVQYRMGGTGKVPSIHFSGRVLGVPEPNDVFSGGFVALLAGDQKIVGEDITGQKHPWLESDKPDNKSRNIISLIRYRLAGTDTAYIFMEAKYKGNECTDNYSLFKQDPKTFKLKVLGGISYGCDI